MKLFFQHRAWDKQHKNNLFYTEGDDYALSTLGQHFLAGVMDHLPGLMAILAPSYNSYRRFHKGSWSGGEYLSYGTDNRESAVRIPSRYLGNEMGSVNIEVKPADNSANPYLAIGSIIAAGIDGMEKKRDPGQPLNINMYKDGDNYPNLKKLPTDLEEALEQLSSSEPLLSAFGEKNITSYLKLKQQELKDFNSKETFSKKEPVTEWEKKNTLDC